MSWVHKEFQLNEQSFLNSNEIVGFSQSISKEVYLFLKDWFSDLDFIEVQTSGSTGKPKTIPLKKEFMVNSALSTGAFFNLPEKTTALLCMSPNYIAGKMMLVRALVLGWHLDIVEPISNPLKNSEKKYDFSAMVPMQLQNSLFEIHKIKKLIVGGGIVSVDLVSKIQEVPTKIFATFGMTETITHIAVKKLNGFKNRTSSEEEKACFITFPNVSITIDSRNCLVVNALKVSETQITTNDVVKIISKNKFKWLGRVDNVINSGGIKLHPEEIEKKLTKIISQRFFVAGIPDTNLGEKLVLIVEENVTSSEVEKSLRNQLELVLNNEKHLTKYEMPKAIYFVAEFIETDTKKIQRSKTLDLI